MASPFASLLAGDYAQAIAKLFPRGRAWIGKVGSVLNNFRNAVAAAVYILHQAVIDLIDTELNPATSNLLLPTWENDFGLPDPCIGTGQTIAQRQAALIARVADPGGLNPQRYINLAAMQGFNVTIDEFTPFTVGGGCGEPVYGPDWQFVWRVNAPAADAGTTALATCIGPCTEPLASWGNTILECLINSRNRASRIVLFGYNL